MFDKYASGKKQQSTSPLFMNDFHLFFYNEDGMKKSNKSREGWSYPAALDIIN